MNATPAVTLSSNANAATILAYDNTSKSTSPSKSEADRDAVRSRSDDSKDFVIPMNGVIEEKNRKTLL